MKTFKSVLFFVALTAIISAIIILLVGLFNMSLFLPCFGFGLLSTVFFILTAKILNNEK
jgi:uncharacterized membrane protein YuzA (DUF378 family)